jgi:hypothetical protein
MSTSELLAKICKIRGLAGNNAEPHEVASAKAKYTEMLTEHGLTEADLDRHESRGQPPPVPFSRPGMRPFPGGVVIHVVPGQAFGGVFSQFFGGGFGFEVRFGGGDTSTSSR